MDATTNHFPAISKSQDHVEFELLFGSISLSDYYSLFADDRDTNDQSIENPEPFLRSLTSVERGESNVSVNIESRPEDGDDWEMKIKNDSESNASVEDREIMVKNDNIPNRLSRRFSNRLSKHLLSMHRISKHRELKRVSTYQILNKHLTKHGVSISRLFNRQHRWHMYVKWRERWEWQSCISMFW